MTNPDWPTLILEIATSQPPSNTYITFGSAFGGAPTFDHQTFAPDAYFTDITQQFRGCTIQRGRSRALDHFNPATMTVELDTSDKINYTVTSIADAAPNTLVRLRATYAGITYYLFNGYIDTAASNYTPGNLSYPSITLTCSDAFKPLQRYQPAAAGSPVGGGEDTGARVSRILDSAGWSTTARELATGNSNLQAIALGSTTALDDIYAAVDSERGQFFITPSGDARFENRNYRLSNRTSINPQFVWSDNYAALHSFTSGTLSTDSFNRANSTSLGSTDGSGFDDPATWVKGFSETTTGCHISGNVVTNGGPDNSTPHAYHIARLNLNRGDVTLSLAVANVGGSSSWAGGIVFRYSDDNNFYYAGLFGDSTVKLYERLSSTDTLISSVSVGATSGTVGVTATGTSVTVTFNGTSEITATDNDLTTQTSHGIGFRNDPAGSLNSSTLDNWSAIGLGVNGDLFTAATELYDDTLVANNVTGQIVGSSNPQNAQDATSITNNFECSYNNTSLQLQTDADALNWAQWVLHEEKSPAIRIDQITCEPLGNPTVLFPEVLGRNISDMVQVAPSGQMVSESVGYYVEGVSHHITTGDGSPANWVTTFLLSPSQINLGSPNTGFLVFDDPVYGKLDANSFAGF